MRRLIATAAALLLAVGPLARPAFAASRKYSVQTTKGKALAALDPGTWFLGGWQITADPWIRAQNDAQAEEAFRADPLGHGGGWNERGLSCWGHAAVMAVDGARHDRGETLPILQKLIRPKGDDANATVTWFDNASIDRTKPFVESTMDVPLVVYRSGMRKNIHINGGSSDTITFWRQHNAVVKLARDNKDLAVYGEMANKGGNTGDAFEWLTGKPATIYADGSVTLWSGKPQTYKADKVTFDSIRAEIQKAHAAQNPIGVDTMSPDKKTGDASNRGTLDRIADAVQAGILDPKASTITSIKQIGLYPGHAFVLRNPKTYALTSAQEKFYADRGLLGVETAEGRYIGSDGKELQRDDGTGELLVPGYEIIDPALKESIGDKTLVSKRNPGFNLFGNEGRSIVPEAAAFALFGFVHLGQI